MDGRDGRSFVAAQDFLLGVKTHWTTRLYPELAADYDAKAQAADTVTDVEEKLGETSTYRIFAFLERHLQRLKYSGRYGIHTWYDATQRETLARYLDTDDLPQGILALDPDLSLPAYYTGCDIHQHPGGVWSDAIAGAVYERGARSTTPLAAEKHRDLHDRLTDCIVANDPPKQLVDLGCGFGKSTRPLYDALRGAGDVIGVDLAEPCLRLAAREAATAQARNVRFVQADCAATGLGDESADVVTSTMLLHELPPDHVRASLREAWRLLKPGGRMIHLDFYVVPDVFREFIHLGHARRNNEPYMITLREMNLENEIADAGFEAAEVTPFQEADGTLDAAYPNWRFPWTLITATKPSG